MVDGLVLLPLIGFFVMLSLAGLVFDLVHRQAQPYSWRNGSVHRRALATLRYYRDVGDSSSA